MVGYKVLGMPCSFLCCDYGMEGEGGGEGRIVGRNLVVNVGLGMGYFWGR